MTRRMARAVAVVSCVLLIATVLALRSGNGPPAEAAEPDTKTPPPTVEGDAIQFVIEPYLQLPTRESIVVMWETNLPGSASVAYGKSPLDMKKATAAGPATLHEIKLDGLESDTKYYYQTTTVAEGKTLASKVLTFTTAVQPDSAFAFTLVGDTQRNPKITGRIANLMFERRPNFVVHLGDVVDHGPDKKQWVGDLFGPSSALFSRVALFPCIGNHEKNHAFYYQYFSLPAPEYYYRYRYGNADFFVLDTNKPVKAGSEQYAWLDRELARSDAKWKFAYHHHPAYSSDGDDYGNTWTGLTPSTLGDLNARSLVALYEKHNVDVVFNGHIHLYERTWPIRGGKVDRKNGITFVTSGGGGGKLETVGPTATWFKAECRTDFHYCYVTVHGEQLNFKAFDQNDMLFDYFEIRK
jgi:acid phosphatase type 7